MESTKEYVYCKDCKHWYWRPLFSVKAEKGWCVATVSINKESPIGPELIRDSYEKLNANNDCPHFEVKPKMVIEESETRPWWKFWR